MNKMTISVRQHVSFEDISDLLESAWQGSSYWATAEKYINPKVWEFDSHLKFSGSEDGKHFSQDYALNEGGAVLIRDCEADKVYHLDLAAIKKGLNIMAKKWPRHWANFVNEDYDMETGDVFLQCCLLGDIIYG